MLMRKSVSFSKARRECRHANLVRTLGMTQCEHSFPPPPLSLKKILATHLAYVQSKYTNGNIIIIIIILILLLFSLSLFLVKVDTTAASALCIVGQ